ncbi:nucleoside triphosphate pyrophosphohydrolase [Aquibaculum arenosum]|uniref:Nucleoside triphosphate pyrophosphohydrolase n=1 Tax=Aquibaculum arenosum TaxID=3032591 RepID=A0ABT5YN78_9PROT|nr:nucleoside triphosphate pyrophosphohydrolase [Fodinicurvata sp. CAU 1616]MDF2096190.1 nucleoside triphosphate pyrophosphohydrolase [Fodinicurvata sp. CAU 1616]
MSEPPAPHKPAIDRLLAVMARLRDPQDGCPWDVAQTFETIAPYTIEEAYEVHDAIERGDRAALCDELGDLLLQVVFHARMAEEEGSFDFNDVAAAIERKMLDRHPHVFAATTYDTPRAQKLGWEAIKAQERAAKGEKGVLDGVPPALPALLRAWKLQRRAARVGFDWPTVEPVLAKVREELDELEAELTGTVDKTRVEEELGDLLFSIVNLARHLDVEPETALRRGNAKFERRFRQVEAEVAEAGASLSACSLEQLEGAWQNAKSREAPTSTETKGDRQG